MRERELVLTVRDKQRIDVVQRVASGTLGHEDAAKIIGRTARMIFRLLDRHATIPFPNVATPKLRPSNLDHEHKHEHERKHEHKHEHEHEKRRPSSQKTN